MASRHKVKGRKESGRFTLLPHAVLNTDDYIGLSTKSKALLVDLAYQYNGKNNGDLTAAMAILRDRGWKRDARRAACTQPEGKVQVCFFLEKK